MAVSAIDTPFLALVRRELLTNLRTVRAFALVATAVVLCIIPTVALFPQDISDVRNSGSIFTVLLGIVLFASALIVPGLAASAVSVERERETLDLLLMSTVRPWGILIAKFINAVGFYFLLFAAVLPVMSTVLFLAGVDASYLVFSFVMLFAYTISLTCFGLLCSVLFRKTFTAIIASYICMILISGMAPVLVAMLAFFAVYLTSDFGSNMWIGEEPLVILMTVGSPLSILLGPEFSDMLISELGFWGNFTYAVWGQVVVHSIPALYQIGIGLLALAVARRYIVRDIHGRAEIATKVIDDAEELRKRRQRFPYYLIDPARRKKLIEDGRNPVLVKELRWGATRNLTIYIRIFYVTFLFFAITNAMYWVGSGVDFDSSLAYIFTMQTAVSCCIAPALMSNALTREFETGNLDMLRSTMLSPRDIIRGKWIACFIAASPVLGSALICDIPFFFSPYLWSIAGDVIIVGTIMLITSTVFVMNIAFFASSMARSTAMAIVSGYASALAVFVVVPIMLTFLIVIAADGYPDEEIFYFTTFLSPPAAFMFFFDDYRGSNIMSNYREVRSMFSFYMLFNIAYTIAASAFLLWATQLRFARRMAKGES